MTRAILEFVLGYLANSLWQVPLIFLAAWLVTRLTKQAGPRIAHRVWVGAMMIEVILPACRMDVPAAWWWLASFAWTHLGEGSLHGTARVVQGAGIAAQSGALLLPEPVLTWIAWAYAASLLYFAGRLAWGVWRTSRVRRTVVPAPARWTRRLDLMGAKVAVSSLVSGPSTIGFRRGLLLLPPALLEAATEGDLDAALAHECAHIERSDFTKNLFYQLISLPVAYHPVLLITRARIAETREMICDAIAAEAVQGRESYARSLLKLASMITDLQSSSARTIHAIGMFDANDFERRIMNLVEKRIEVTKARRVLAAALCAVVAVGTCASALALHVNVSAPGATNAAAQKGIDIASGDIAGNKISGNNPVYPKDAKASGKTLDGTVVLAATISKDGAIEHLSVKKSLRGDYDKSAIDAVRTWLYKPYLLNGEPVEVETTINITYSLKP